MECLVSVGIVHGLKMITNMQLTYFYLLQTKAGYVLVYQRRSPEVKVPAALGTPDNHASFSNGACESDENEMETN